MYGVLFLILMLEGALPAVALEGSAELIPVRLRCEHRENPMGIDTPKPRLGWICDGKPLARGLRQTAYQVLVALTREGLEGDKPDLWDSGKVCSDQSDQIEYAGKSLPSGRTLWWKVRVWDQDGDVSPWSAPASWIMGLLQPSDWQGEWIGAKKGETTATRHYFRNGKRGDAPKISPGREESPAPLFRRVVKLEKKPVRATAFICGLGLQECFMNGRRVGDQVLSPAFTDYGVRVCYTTHDVTSLLHQGQNTIGVILGNGFFSTPTFDLFQFEKAYWRTPPKLRLNIRVEFEDGTSMTIATDESWKCGEGQIRFNCLRGGETVDWRRDPGAWLNADYDDQKWPAATKVPAPKGKLCAQAAPAMRIVKTRKALRITQPKPGVYLADFGRNMTGWVRLETQGKAGQTVTLDYNEVLRKDGTLDTSYQGSHTYGRFNRDILILSGRGREVLEPRFTYHGFRYVQFEGLDHEPTPEMLTACMVHADLTPAGSFECSNAHLNQLQAAVLRTLLDCIHWMPGEEPVREKMGWTQDGSNTLLAYLYNFDATAAYEKYTWDMMDSQAPNGHVPPIVPTNGWGLQDEKGNFEFCDDPWWGGTLLWVSDYLYQYRGDRRLIEQSYGAMKGYVDFLGTIAKDDVVSWGLGDWLNAGVGKPGACGKVPLAQTSTAGYYYFVRCLARYGALLGKTQDAERYGALAERIKVSFNRKFLSAEAWYTTDSQTAQGLPLFLDLVPEQSKVQVAARLVEDLEKRGRHLTTGFLGVMPSLYWLGDNGYGELAYAAVAHEQGDGWLYMVEGEEPTLGESLYPHQNTMRHHPFAACIGAWFYRDLAGIRPALGSPGFARTIIRPVVPSGLAWVKAQTETPRGRVAVRWEKKDGRLVLEVTIPPNSSAEVYVPVGDGEAVRESGREAATAQCVKQLRREGNSVVLQVGSGCYRFESVWNADRN